MTLEEKKRSILSLIAGQRASLSRAITAPEKDRRGHIDEADRVADLIARWVDCLTAD